VIVSPPAPKHGYRGGVTPLALSDRDRKYRGEHEASIRAERQPQTFRALAKWFVLEWEASLPTRMHTRGVEADSALGSPKMAPAVASRLNNASDHGWGVTGWDRDGNPRGMTKDGEHTRDPFLYYLERLLNGGAADRMGATCLLRWAYNGWDVEATALAIYRRTHDDGAGVLYEAQALEALLERTIRTLWRQCQSEPVRYSICRECRRRECVCGQRSEAQVNAEDAA
jgi:hypothetical protein